MSSPRTSQRGESSSSGDYINQPIIPSGRSRGNNLVTADGITNIFVIVLFAFVILAHVVCLIVLQEKREELTDKFQDDIDHVQDNCILFINNYENDQWALTNSTSCDLVIHGSEALSGCASFMIIFLVIRSVLFKNVNSTHNTLIFIKTNVLGIVDSVEVLATGLFAGVLAVIVTLGKNQTCSTLEDVSGKLCKDAMISYNNHHARVYRALLTAEVTSWIAVSVMCLIAMVTGVRMLLWMMYRRHRHGSSILEHSALLDHNYLLRTSYVE